MGSIYTYKDKHDLYLLMTSLTEEDARYVFSVLKKNDDEFSENSNGIFFDINRVCDRTMCELIMYFKHLRPSLYD
jgi:hypothetical protein